MGGGKLLIGGVFKLFLGLFYTNDHLTFAQILRIHLGAGTIKLFMTVIVAVL